MSTGARYLNMRPTLGCSDLASSVAFYRKVLGLEVFATQGDPIEFALLGRDEVQLSLVAAGEPAVAEFAAVYVTVDDVHEAYARCVKAGAFLKNSLTQHPWGMQDFVIMDPDGHKIAIGQRVAALA